MHNQGLIDDAEAADRREIFDWIVWKRSIEVRIGNKCYVGGREQRVAIRHRLGDVSSPDLAVGASLVLDDDGPTPRHREPLGHRPRDHVCGSSGGVSHHDCDGFGGVGLGLRRYWTKRHATERREDADASDHVSLSSLSLQKPHPRSWDQVATTLYA